MPDCSEYPINDYRSSLLLSGIYNSLLIFILEIYRVLINNNQYQFSAFKSPIIVTPSHI
jgi:hypothetical protein